MVVVVVVVVVDDEVALATVGGGHTPAPNDSTSREAAFDEPLSSESVDTATGLAVGVDASTAAGDEATCASAATVDVVEVVVVVVDAVDVVDDDDDDDVEGVCGSSPSKSYCVP